MLHRPKLFLPLLVSLLFYGAPVCAEDAHLVLPVVPASQDSALAAAEALRGGQPLLAEQLAGRVIMLPDPPVADRAQALLTRGLAREQLGRPFEAMADFTQAIDLNVLPPSDQARAYFDRGVTRDSVGELPEAISDYGAALNLVPQFPAALNNRANAYRRSGQAEAAKADYLASLAAGNSAPEYPYFGLGQIAEADGDIAAACDFYRKALQANANYTLASKRLAELGQPWSSEKLVLRPPTRKIAAPTKPRVTDLPVQHEIAANAPSLRPAMLDAKANARVAAMDAVQSDSAKSATSRAPKTAQVQLGAFNSENAANDAWKRLVRTAGGQLSGLTPQIATADIPGRGRFYRLRTGPVQSATAFCTQLNAQGVDCIPVRN